MTRSWDWPGRLGLGSVDCAGFGGGLVDFVGGFGVGPDAGGVVVVPFFEDVGPVAQASDGDELGLDAVYALPWRLADTRQDSLAAAGSPGLFTAETPSPQRIQNKQELTHKITNWFIPHVAQLTLLIPPRLLCDRRDSAVNHEFFRLRAAARDSQPPGSEERFQLCVDRITSSSRELAWCNPLFLPPGISP